MFKESQPSKVSTQKKPSDWALESTCPKGQKPGPLPGYGSAKVKAGKHHK